MPHKQAFVSAEAGLDKAGKLFKPPNLLAYMHYLYISPDSPSPKTMPYLSITGSFCTVVPHYIPVTEQGINPTEFMEQYKRFTSSTAVMVVASVLLVVAMAPRPASSQVATACTASMISSFTPCLNYLTGSSNGGSSPTADCCGALGGLVSSSTQCGCLILTGNVPFSLPINRTLAISLPRACKSKSVPLFQCKGSATPIPPPGAPIGGPGLPALPPFPTAPSVLSPPAPPLPAKTLPLAPAAAPSAPSQPAAEGLRPFVLPSSAVMVASACTFVSLLVPVAVGAALLLVRS